MKEPDYRLEDSEIKEMIAHIEASFRELRQFILSGAGKNEFIEKADGSPVTKTDAEVENILLSSFRAQFPKVPAYGEESGYDHALPSAFWLFDPIDGTASFIKNIPSFTSMAVLIADDQAIASVIYNPTSDEMFVAHKNNGAFKNGVRLNLQEIPLATTALCKGRYNKKLSEFLNPVGITCALGSVGAGHGFSLVADGASAARFQLNSGGYPHDYATGALLVEEAGGKIILVNDKKRNYKTKSFVACHPSIAHIITDNIEEIRQLEQSF